MAEVSEKVARLSDSEIISAFRDALIAVYPILQRLDAMSDDTQPYDPFDEIAESLWNVLVLQSLQWKHGLESAPQLPPYGFHDVAAGTDGFIEVRAPQMAPFRFIQFLGNRELGSEPFNCVEGVTPFGLPASVAFSDQVSFSWVKAGG